MDISTDDLDTIDVDYDMAVEDGDATRQKDIFNAVVELAQNLVWDLNDANAEIEKLEAEAESDSDECGGGYYCMRDEMLRNFDGSVGDRMILEEMFHEFENKTGMGHINSWS